MDTKTWAEDQKTNDDHSFKTTRKAPQLSPDLTQNALADRRPSPVWQHGRGEYSPVPMLAGSSKSNREVEASPISSVVEDIDSIRPDRMNVAAQIAGFIEWMDARRCMGGRVRAAATLGSMLVSALLTVGPASATTEITLESEPGDLVGGGQSLTLTEAEGTISIQREIDNALEINFRGDTRWFLGFAAPRQRVLIPGPYDDATRYPFQSPANPGLSVRRNSRGCNRLTGRFDVLEAEYGPEGEVLRFAADFEQHCEGLAPALAGRVMFNSGGPPFPPPPDQDEDGVLDAVDNCPMVPNPDQADDDLDMIGAVCDGEFTVRSIEFNSEPGDYIGGGEHFRLTVGNGELTSATTSTRFVTFHFDGSDAWMLSFAAPGNATLVPGSYQGARRFPLQPSTKPGLSVSGAGRGCNSLTGRFDVFEAEYGPEGEVQKFAADFEQHCEGLGPALFGQLRFNTDLPCHCADPDASEGLPTAGDCLKVLHAAVGLEGSCPAECCNVDARSGISAVDALYCLKCAVGSRDCTCSQ